MAENRMFVAIPIPLELAEQIYRILPNYKFLRDTTPEIIKLPFILWERSEIFRP